MQMQGSRLSLPKVNVVRKELLLSKVPKAIELEGVAKEIGCTMAQLAIAWCSSNKHVSTVLMGATSVEQLDENLKALDYVDKITPEIRKKIDDIVQFKLTPLPDTEAFVFKIRERYL